MSILFEFWACVPNADTLIFHAMQKRKKKNKHSLCAGQLFTDALALAKKTTLEELFRKTDLPLSWLLKFRGGEIPNPSVNRIEKILIAFDALPGRGKTVNL